MSDSQEKNPPGVQGGSDAGRWIQGRIGLVNDSNYAAWVRQVTTDTSLDVHTRVIILAYGASARESTVFVKEGDQLQERAALLTERIPKELCDEIGVSDSKFYRSQKNGLIEGTHLMVWSVFEYETASKTAKANTYLLTLTLEGDHIPQ